MLLLRTGLVSFGQALYYCLGAYAAGGMGTAFYASDVILLRCSPAPPPPAFSPSSWGSSSRNTADIFFGMLSLAFSMILYGLLVKSEALGTTDGFNIRLPTVFGVRPVEASVRYVVFVRGVRRRHPRRRCCVYRYLRRRRWGSLAPAIKDNELRVEYMGASVRRRDPRQVRDRRRPRRHRWSARGDHGRAHRSGNGVLDHLRRIRLRDDPSRHRERGRAVPRRR